MTKKPVNVAQKSVLLLLTIMLAATCTKKETGQQLPLDEKYQDWKTYTYQNIKIIYPPGHPLVNSFEEMAKGYVMAMKRDCQFLHIKVPKDTLVVYYYSGFKQGTEMTGREYPFATDSAIHFWLPSYYGPTLMQYLIRRWQDVEPRYTFLKHGLIALLDYSGQSYHESTLEFIDEERFIPLKELAVDTMVNSDKERHRTAEAASFVDFIVFNYGIEKFNRLYRSQSPFEETIEEICEVPVDSVQVLWLDFADRAVEAMYKTLESEWEQ